MTDSTAGTSPATDGQPGAGDEPLGDGGKKALDAERKARREAEQRARQAEDRARDLEAADLRREIASDKGLTAAQAKRLTGSTREELAADADDLLAAFGGSSEDGRRPKSRPHEAGLREGSVPNAGHEPDYADLAGRIYNG